MDCPTFQQVWTYTIYNITQPIHIIAPLSAHQLPVGVHISLQTNTESLTGPQVSRPSSPQPPSRLWRTWRRRCETSLRSPRRSTASDSTLGEPIGTSPDGNWSAWHEVEHTGSVWRTLSRVSKTWRRPIEVIWINNVNPYCIWIYLANYGKLYIILLPAITSLTPRESRNPSRHHLATRHLGRWRSDAGSLLADGLKGTSEPETMALKQ